MDGEQLAALYTRYGYTVFRRCVAYLGVNDAPEAMRAVFVRALRGGGSTPAPALRGGGPERGTADPRTWLCRIADELCAAQLRDTQGGKRENASNTEASGFVSTAPGAVAAGASGRSSSVPSGMSQAEADALERAVAADDLDALFAVQRLLPRIEPELRRLAVLYYLDELTEEQLAHELGWSRRAVSKRLEHLIEQARALWSERAAS